MADHIGAALGMMVDIQVAFFCIQFVIDSNFNCLHGTSLICLNYRKGDREEKNKCGNWAGAQKNIFSHPQLLTISLLFNIIASLDI